MMKQKLVNEYLLDFIGKSQKQKELDQMFKFLLEEKTKFLGLRPLIHEVSLVTVTDPLEKKYPEILKVGGSKPDDLITNQLAIFLATLVGPVSGVLVQMTINDNTGTPRIVSVRGNEGTSRNLWYRLNVGGSFVSTGSSIQVGQGTTPPARSDFDVETAFANGGPEDTSGGVNVSVYNSTLGRVTVSRTIGPTAGAGTVTEAGHFMGLLAPTEAFLRRYLMYHDAVSPGVSFILGQNINVFYTAQI